ncbi:adenosine 3'-phospho 5'-phosphosulfate transporter 2 [Carlito syrichta]|uniref:Adenosine 3'-phospho 5'-phosphosulfate transporter 2 n=1 Tax=Carlito syrichta TaxID=1868482 RepID=A0A3Q0E5X9_CARSF|nr:adenosine 3'-phospho 5'-phosphosulfate transporter 2 [Carlito syrichta]
MNRAETRRQRYCDFFRISLRSNGGNERTEGFKNLVSTLSTWPPSQISAQGHDAEVASLVGSHGVRGPSQVDPGPRPRVDGACSGGNGAHAGGGPRPAGGGGGGVTRLRTRAGTHRRKWRVGAGVASTFRESGRRGGKCRSRREGGGRRGGDGDGPGEGETFRLAEAPPGLGSPFQVTYRLWGLDTASKRKNKREETKITFKSIEYSKITMDLKFNNSRKYISITVPSKTQTMSPHIKSVDDIIVLGINLSKFNKLTQFFICVAGVFVFYLIYGYLQELIFSVEGFKSYGWYLTLVQFAFYSIFGLIELQLIQDKRRRIPGKTYMIIAFLTVGTMGLSNTSLGYLNYPTQVIFKCCKLIPVMLGGVFIQGKRYSFVDVSAALCMSLGLIWFTLADSTIAPNFNLTGVMLISLALCADAVIGNVQEKAMKLHNASNSEMVLYSYSIGFVYILLGLTCTSGLGPAVTFCSKNPIRTYGYAFLFSLTGYFGISFVLALIKIFGALLAVTVTTGRKAMTIVLSFIFFAKPFTFQYVWSGLLVVLGIFLNVYSKNMDKIKLSSLYDLINKSVGARKSRTLAQTV